MTQNIRTPISRQPASGIALSGSGAHSGADPASGVNPAVRDGTAPANKVTITLGGSGSSSGSPGGPRATETVIAMACSDDVIGGVDGSPGAEDLDGIFCLGDTGQDVLANNAVVLLGGESAADLILSGAPTNGSLPVPTDVAPHSTDHRQAVALQGLAVLRNASELANGYVGGTTLTLSNGEQIIVGPITVR